MKILQSVILVTVLCVSFPCLSQPISEGGPALSAGCKALLGEATFYRRGNDNGVSYRYRLSYGAGIFAYLSLFYGTWGQLGLQPELMWVRRATITEFDNGVLGSSYRIDSLDLPVLMRMGYAMSDRLILHAAVGPRLGFQLDAKRTDINGNIQDLTDLRKFELGASIGAGVAVALPRFSLTIEGRYDQGLLDIANDNEDVDLRHRAFFLMLGVSMGIGGPAPASADASSAP